MSAKNHKLMIIWKRVEQAYVKISSAVVLKEAGWTESLFNPLTIIGAGAM